VTAQTILEGPKNLKPGKFWLTELDDQVYAGNTPGGKKSIRSKHDGNEDFVGFSRRNGAILFGIADAHFGAISGKIAVKKLEDTWDFVHKNPIRTLFNHHYHMDHEVKALASESPMRSATTLISGLLQGQELSWVSTGDSSMFLFRNSQMTALTKRKTSLFIGEFPEIEKTFHETFRVPHTILEQPDHIIYCHLIFSHISNLANEGKLELADLSIMLQKIEDHSGVSFTEDPSTLTKSWHPANTRAFKRIPDWGQIQLQPEDILLAVTDGLYEENNSDQWHDIQSTLANHSFTEAGEILLANSLKQGGLDNASFLAIRVPSAK